MNLRMLAPLLIGTVCLACTMAQDMPQLDKNADKIFRDVPLLVPAAGNSPQIGIAVDELSDQLKEHLDVSSGVFIRLVIADSAASHAGIREGDLLIRVDGESVGSAADLLSIMQARKSGDTLTVELIRSGAALVVQVKLTDPTPESADADRPGLGLGLGDFLQKQLEQLGNRLDDQVDLGRLEQIEQLLGRKIFDIRRGATVPEAKTLRIEIDRSGEGPAVIRITRDGKTIEADTSSLSTLPRDIRNMLEPLLGAGNRLKIDLGGMVIEVPYKQVQPSAHSSADTDQSAESVPHPSPAAPLVPPAMNLPREKHGGDKPFIPQQIQALPGGPGSGKDQPVPHGKSPHAPASGAETKQSLEEIHREIEAMRQQLDELRRELNAWQHQAKPAKERASNRE